VSRSPNCCGNTKERGTQAKHGMLLHTSAPVVGSLLANIMAKIKLPA